MDVLIAGCGYIGEELGRALAARELEVVGLRRFPRPGAELPFPVIAGDLGREGGLDALRTLPRRIVYAAAAEGYHDEAYRLAYVVGPGNLARRCRELGGLPERLVYVSSTAVYHQMDGSWVDERSPTEPEIFSGKRLLEGEALVRALETTAICLRCGGIYGPGRKRLIDQFLSGQARLTRGGQYGNRIHRDDVVGAIVHLLELEDPAELYLGVDHQPATQNEIWRFLARETGRELPPEEAGEISSGGRSGNKRCKNDRLADSGYDFRHPSYREGLRSLLVS